MLSFLDLEQLEFLFPAAEQFYPGTHADLIHSFPRRICCALKLEGNYNYAIYYVKNGEVWMCDEDNVPTPVSLPFQVAAIEAYNSDLILTSAADGLDYTSKGGVVSVQYLRSDRLSDLSVYLCQLVKLTLPPLDKITRILMQGSIYCGQYSTVTLTTSGAVLYATQEDLALQRLECPEPIYQLVLQLQGYLLRARSGNVYYLHQRRLQRL